MLPPTGRRMADAGLRFQQICNQLPSCRRQSVLPPAAISIPRRRGRACSWMIWPSGGGALSVAVYDWIFTLLLVLRFNRFCLFQQICNLLPLLLSWQVCNQPCSTLQSSCNLLPAAAGEARPPAVRTTAQPYTAAGFLDSRSTEIRFRGSASLHRCCASSAHSRGRLASSAEIPYCVLASDQAGRLCRGWFLCFKDSAPGGREESPPWNSPQRVPGGSGS